MFGHPYRCCLQGQLTVGRHAGAVRPLFLYGTLRPGSWNHADWMAPFLAAPCRSARVAGVALHHVGGLPYLVAAADAFVVGDLADLDPDRYGSILEILDEFEGTHAGHYRRTVVVTEAGEEAWAWLAGDELASSVDDTTLVPGGDWLEVRSR
jgi:periplasmic divalent cation tolerance protein